MKKEKKMETVEIWTFTGEHGDDQWASALNERIHSGGSRKPEKSSWTLSNRNIQYVGEPYHVLERIRGKRGKGRPLATSLNDILDIYNVFYKNSLQLYYDCLLNCILQSCSDGMANEAPAIAADNMGVPNCDIVGVLLPKILNTPFDSRRLAGAVDEGFMVAKRDYNVTFDALYNLYDGEEFNCPKESVLGYFANMSFINKIDAVVGPDCSDSIIGVGRLADYLNIPIVSGQGELVARNHLTGDLLRTTSLLSYKIDTATLAIAAILKKYLYKNVVVLYDLTSVFTTQAGSSMYSTINADKYFTRPFQYQFDSNFTEEYDVLLLQAKHVARVFIFFTSADDFRTLLYRAYQLGMANGDYVFITLEIFPSDWMGYFMEFIKGDEMDHGVAQAYQTVLILRLLSSNSTVYTAFAHQVKLRSKNKYGYEYQPTEQVSYFAVGYYDAVMYLANAYNNTLMEGGNISNGATIARKFWNHTFPGLLGPVTVNADGDRMADFELFDMMSPTKPMMVPTTQYFQSVGIYKGSMDKYTPINGRSIVWPNGKPADVPKCGFTDNLCSKHDVDIILIAVLVPAIFCLCVASVVVQNICRKAKNELYVQQTAWLVEFHEILAWKEKFHNSYISDAIFNVENTLGENKEYFCTKAICRNKVVARKSLYVQTVEMTSHLEDDFRHMLTLSHPNLAKFVGTCLEPGHICILMEFCQRGSLKFIIHSEDVDLHWDFKFSLIHDIIQGMVYLQSSSLKLHGHLSSSNCVIDSRFSLKITDYGPVHLLALNREEEMKEYSEHYNKKKMLWLAPELLRSTSYDHHFSQKGDVYSFAIILQELISRQEPFEENNMEVEDILDQLKNRPGSLRPVVKEKACTPELMSLMKSCWNEDPEKRPSFHDIEESYRKMKRGQSTNNMDNLIERMTDYADSLEFSTAEKTKSYLEEKRRVEELIHRLLPPSVAKQLQAGEKVIPESFESVTVYFSDVVEFNIICNSSTPVELVSFLNDLNMAIDKIKVDFRVYEVETIGDAHMCVSGIPERIGDSHVSEICEMALEFLKTVRAFKIKHMPTHTLMCRIGIHSGPVVAGVVGRTLQRYCLFGETVITATRMETNSQPMRIHISKDTKILLEKFSKFKVESRGQIPIKGLGVKETFWLLEPSDTKKP